MNRNAYSPDPAAAFPLFNELIEKIQDGDAAAAHPHHLCVVPRHVPDFPGGPRPCPAARRTACPIFVCACQGDRARCCGPAPDPDNPHVSRNVPVDRDLEIVDRRGASRYARSAWHAT
jgi:hypothetical protein